MHAKNGRVWYSDSVMCREWQNDLQGDNNHNRHFQARYGEKSFVPFVHISNTNNYHINDGRKYTAQIHNQSVLSANANQITSIPDITCMTLIPGSPVFSEQH